MAEQSNIQTQVQTQSQVQIQTLSPQQVLEARLLALSTLELEEHVRSELNDNPALEDGTSEPLSQDTETTEPDDELYDEGADDYREDRSGSDDWNDDDDDWYDRSDRGMSGTVADVPLADTRSFYDLLYEQLREQDLTERQMKIALYIIGSIDNDGLLDKDVQAISDDLAFYHDLDASTDEIEQVLKVIQDFDPAGIGARNLQECLLIQIRRKEDSPLKALQEKVISTMFDEFTHKRWDKISARLGIDKEQTDAVIAELVKLNPRPGSSLGETVGHSRQHIVPDFILENYDGDITFTLNNGNIPQLHVSREYSDMLDRQIKGGNSNQRDAALYIKRKLDSAKGFIQALHQREVTLTRTMQAIIDMQRPFFTEGDDTLLKPMILKDVAERTGYDISTISRVTSGKYVQTNFGTFPLKAFFTDGVKTSSGEEVSVKEIHRILREVTDAEDHSNPLTDEQLADILAERGYKVARRTVAKYREQIGIPVARLRKK
ncbi:MAG: RNA polymerase factor sigma-54 [Bacteroidaceae bacterium]|nr:RNA polymerase factor sigma-54 [Bacteroidaceae bacterium]